jgi:hypothetical protein
LILPVDFEREMAHFTPSALKTFLTIRFRTIFNNHVQLTTASLARITGLSEDSVRKALVWLEYPDTRATEEGHPARTLRSYISRRDEKEHTFSDRLVQTIYVNDWKLPKEIIGELTKARGARKTAQNDETEEE